MSDPLANSESKVSYEVDPYDNYIKAPQGNSRPQSAYVSSDTKKAREATEARKKAQLRSRRTTDPTNPLRAHNFELHRERVRTATPVVDSSCPIIAKSLYSSSTAFNRKIANFSRIERENAVLLRRIAAILEGNGTIDNRLKPTTRNINNRGRARQDKLLKTTFENLTLLKRIQEQKPTYSRKAQLADFAKKEKIMSRLSYYPLFWKIQSPKGWENLEREALLNAQANPKPLVFLDVGTDQEILGRIVIELRADVVPMTAENFRCLCTGETEKEKCTGQPVSYKCSQFTRIIPGILWQGGDVPGSSSIYGETFPDENFKLKHDGPGVVSMFNYGKNTNGCQFIIDARPMPILDGVNVVVGRVIGGLHILHKITNFVGPNGRPKSPIWIFECGQLSSVDDVTTDEGEASDREGAGYVSEAEATTEEE